MPGVGVEAAGKEDLRVQATATIDAGIQLAKQAALSKELMLVQTGAAGEGVQAERKEVSSEHLRAQAAATIDAGIQLAREAALKKESLQAQAVTQDTLDHIIMESSGSAKNAALAEDMRMQAAATIDAGIQLAKQAAMNKEFLANALTPPSDCEVAPCASYHDSQALSSASPFVQF